MQDAITLAVGDRNQSIIDHSEAVSLSRFDINSLFPEHNRVDRQVRGVKCMPVALCAGGGGGRIASLITSYSMEGRCRRGLVENLRVCSAGVGVVHQASGARNKGPMSGGECTAANSTRTGGAGLSCTVYCSLPPGLNWVCGDERWRSFIKIMVQRWLLPCAEADCVGLVLWNVVCWVEKRRDEYLSTVGWVGRLGRASPAVALWRPSQPSCPVAAQR